MARMLRRSLRLKNDNSHDVPSVSTGENVSYTGSSSSKERSFSRSTRPENNTGSQPTVGSHCATGKRIINPSLSQSDVTSNASDTSVTSSDLDESLIREQTEVGHLWEEIPFYCRRTLQLAKNTAMSSAALVVQLLHMVILKLGWELTGKAASGIFWWLGTGWYQLTTLITFLNVFFLTRCLPKIHRFFLLLTPLLLLLGLWFWGFEVWFALLPALNGTSLYAPRTAKVPNPALAPESDVLTAPGEKGMNFLFDAHRIIEIEKHLAAIAAEQIRQKEEYGKMILKIQEQVVQLSDRSQALEERQEEAQPRTSGSEIKDTDNGLLIRIQDLERQIAEHNAAILKEQTAKMNCEHADCVLQKVDAKVRESIQKTFAGNENLPESLLQLLSTKYMSEDDFTTKLQETKQRILKYITHHVSMTGQKPTQTVKERAVAGGAPGITEEEARVIVNNALKLYSQDRTGMVDFALESGGGSILGTRCSETYESKTAVLSLFGFHLWSFTKSPRVVIQPVMYPGDCWAMKGSQGYLAVRLSMRIYPTAFSIEHIPKALSPTGSIESAPKDFAVYGLEDEYQQEGTLLLRDVYDDNGEPLQIFQVMEENQKYFQIVELQIFSNWGHTDYTCLYRFRAHGTPVK